MAVMSEPPVNPVTGLPRESSFGLGQAMGWLFVAFSALWPRICILAFWIFRSEIGRAFDGWVVPVLGLLILPWTTFAYAIMWGVSSDGVFGVEWLVVAFALVLDLGTYGLARHLWSELRG